MRWMWWIAVDAAGGAVTPARLRQGLQLGHAQRAALCARGYILRTGGAGGRDPGQRQACSSLARSGCKVGDMTSRCPAYFFWRSLCRWAMRDLANRICSRACVFLSPTGALGHGASLGDWGTEHGSPRRPSVPFQRIGPLPSPGAIKPRVGSAPVQPVLAALLCCCVLVENRG